MSAHVILCKRHIALSPGMCVQLVPSISHIPWHPGQMWSSFAQECLYIPPSLILSLAGLKMCLNHKGSLIILSFQKMLSWGWRIIFESGFPFQYLPLLSLCAMLVMNILRNSQRELLGNGLFYLQKSLLFKRLPHAVFLSCLFQYNPPV